MNELLQKALEYVNSTEVFLKEQIPDFIIQYLTWCSFECIFYIVLFSLLFFVPFITRLIVGHKLRDGDYHCDGDPANSRGLIHFISLILAIVMGIMACILIPINTYILLKIHIAPKVFLVEKIGSTIQQTSK